MNDSKIPGYGIMTAQRMIMDGYSNEEILDQLRRRYPWATMSDVKEIRRNFDGRDFY